MGRDKPGALLQQHHQDYGWDVVYGDYHAISGCLLSVKDETSLWECGSPWIHGYINMPSQAYLIPRFLVLQKLPLIHVNLLDSYWALWLLAHPALQYHIIEELFDRIPTELIESARIDGAAELRIFGQSSSFVEAHHCSARLHYQWGMNDFFWPMIVISTQAKQPIMVAVQLFSKGTSSMNVVMAVLFMVSVPPLVVFLVFQRFIIGGMTLGSLKG